MSNYNLILEAQRAARSILRADGTSIESITINCGSCDACCHKGPAVLDEDDYDYELDFSNGRHIKTQENGSCWYLKDGKCSIYEHRPAVCKRFDCRPLALLPEDCQAHIEPAIIAAGKARRSETMF